MKIKTKPADITEGFGLVLLLFVALGLVSLCDGCGGTTGPSVELPTKGLP